MKKNIFITSAWFPSNKSTNGIFVKDQAEALARVGHKVAVFVVNRATLREKMKSMFEDKPRYEGSDLVDIIKIDIVFPIPARLLRDPTASYKRWILHRIAKSAKRYARLHGQPDLIHHHGLSDNAYVAEALADQFQIFYVFTEHANYFAYDELNRFNPFETFDDHRRFVLNAFERIAVSKIRAGFYGRIFGAPFVCIPNLISNAFTEPLPVRENDDWFTFICVAVLDRRKRQDLLLKAFASVFRGQKVKLLFVGNGPLSEEYARLSIEMGLHDQVTFMGKRSRDEIVQLLDGAHVCVLSSDQETFGMALAEAMFRGIPVVTTASGGPEEVVTVETGLVTALGDEAELAKGMLEIYANYERYNSIAIRASAMSRYSEGLVVGRLEEIYERVSALHDKNLSDQASGV